MNYYIMGQTKAYETDKRVTVLEVVGNLRRARRFAKRIAEDSEMSVDELHIVGIEDYEDTFGIEYSDTNSDADLAACLIAIRCAKYSLLKEVDAKLLYEPCTNCFYITINDEIIWHDSAENLHVAENIMYVLCRVEKSVIK